MSPCWRIVDVHSRCSLRKIRHMKLSGIWETNWSQVPPWRPDLSLINEKRNCHLVDCTVPTNLRVEMKTRTSTHHHHHRHVTPLAWISLTLTRHFSLSFIASGRFSGLHPISSHSCSMYVLAGRPAFARPYVGVHRSTLLTQYTNQYKDLPKSQKCVKITVVIISVVIGA